jgi:hypothetical protein
MTVGITELPPEGMQLGGVALAGDTERGTKTTEGLSLLFTSAGITVQGPQPQIERLLVWSGLDSATCREKIVLPDGRNAAVMELTSGGQSIRFLFPTETVTPGQAAYLDQALPHWLARYKGAPPAPATPAATNGSGTAPGAPAPPAGNGSTQATPPPADQQSHLAPATAAAAAAAAGMAAGGAAAGLADPPPPPPPPTASPAPPAPPTGALGSPTAPPPPPPAFAGATPTPAGPPPPPPPGMGDGTGWMAAPDPLAGEGSAWGGPPAEATIAPPAKKSGRWRKSKETAASPAASPVDPSRPPYDPPSDPVRLTEATLPPPPPDLPGSPVAGGPAVWRPPVDPVTGQALWDGEHTAEATAPELAPPTRGRAKRRAAKAAAAGGAAVAGATALSGAEATTLPPPPAPGLGATPTSPDPTTAQFDSLDGSPPPGDPGGAQRAATSPDKPRARNTRLLVLLFVALLAVIGGIAYFVVKKHNDNTTTTATSAPGLSAAAADAALAATINLHQNDLPAGWAPSTATGQPTRPPVAPAAAQAQAVRALGQCLGASPATVSGLYAGSVLPGQSGSATSPVFQSPADPTIRMFSATRVMTTADQAKALTVPFTNASFLACYTAYQSSVVSAAVPGASATVSSVSLPAPAGVQVAGFLTTLTIPNQGTEVIGQAFMIGGRIYSVLETTTAGAPVPTDAFTPAYNAVSGRVALAVNK